MPEATVHFPRSTYWLSLASMLLVTLGLGAAGCAADGLRQVRCQTMQVDGREYCVYRTPITETGYDCPAAQPHAVQMNGGTVCSSQKGMPAGHRNRLEDDMSGQPTEPGDPAEPPQDSPGEPGDDDDSVGPGDDSPVDLTASALCANPSQYAGEEIRVTGTFRESRRCKGSGCVSFDASAKADVSHVDVPNRCDNQTCGTDIVVDCAGGPSIVLTPIADFSCGGGGVVCTDPRASRLQTVGGTLRQGNVSGHGQLQVYPWSIEVTGYETTAAPPQPPFTDAGSDV